MKKPKHIVTELYTVLSQKLAKNQLWQDELLSRHTTFKIGGPADLYVEPQTLEELSFVLKQVKAFGEELTILGCGSNVLVLDGGIRGVVISLMKLTNIKTCTNNTLKVSSGFKLKDVSEFALAEGLSGLEFAIGIPGSLGGAVFMNAGAYEGEMSQVVTKVVSVDFSGNIHEYTGAELEFAYRHSIFHDNHEVIGEVEMNLVPGDVVSIRNHMEDLTKRRESKQPLEFASAGSTFKRPTGYYAGTLIDQTGLKGLSVGDAQVSQKHAGFVINVGHAKAQDVLGLIHEIQTRVKKAHGVDLEPEVRIIGEEE